MNEIQITLPYNFVPRDYQLALWKYFEEGGRKAAVVWHRRAGKDLNAIHLLTVMAHKRVGTYWHLFPKYKQGKKIAWDGKTKGGSAFRDAFPKELVASVNNTEMKVTFKNGSIYQIVGADDPDSLVGANPVGIVYSEWPLMSPFVREYLRPIIAENGGWELFIYTPRGKNHGYKLMKTAEDSPRWFAQVLPVTTTGAIDLAVIQEDIDDGMSEAMVQQEYYCSFDAPVEGAYYGEQMNKANTDKRITRVPYEPLLPVHTAWDLGVGDSTAIWFFQLHKEEIRIIDYYEQSGEGIPHYAKILKEKDYSYGRHYAPHDIEVRDFGSGRSRRMIARDHGINFQVIKRQDVDDGIEAVRSILPRCYFDENKCETGIECLKQYCKEWDDKAQVWKNIPKHDWSSHGADAFRYLALSIKKAGNINKNKLPRKAEDEYNPHGEYAQ